MASLLQETSQKVITPEILRSAAKQSQRCLVVPVRLRRAIKKYLREQEVPHLKRKVLRLSESFSGIKDVNLQLAATTSKELVEDPLKSVEQSKRWKIKSCYGDIGFQYRDDETIAYVASRMPAVFSACYRVLNEVRRRLPDFSPSSVLDFGAGTGSAFWALREVWPHSVEKVNIVEPSQSMQRAGRSLIQGLKNLPLIHGYDSIQALNKDISKSEREHDLVIASYVLGEIPSLKDRVTIVRQLWNLTKDALCPHDGICPLVNTGKYCHFVQRLERTSMQRAYKRAKGESLRGFEDEKFSYVVFRRGQRPREPWPLDGMKFETLKEQHAKRNPEDLEIDYEDLIKLNTQIVPYQEVDPVTYDSDVIETEILDDGEEEGEEEQGESALADLGGGWGRIVFPPIRRGRHVSMDICRSTTRDASEGSFERVIVTQSKNPTLHHQARRSVWGDLWPF
ncbi:methyltransferase-like protein 17, mitochondrial isoform X2 [Cucurbita moschata]|uniref:Methyltransferase-like protein 17, mitochondrial isoform X2 n=1 Tax=Cucurbita moschata TaxID=3662 RepID=A0A6J1H3Q3_CUCMO|nr:methyltransferase-like protein 17, mitochondrial isoform X2 [Cucurbita moschata]